MIIIYDVIICSFFCLFCHLKTIDNNAVIVQIIKIKAIDNYYYL